MKIKFISIALVSGLLSFMSCSDRNHDDTIVLKTNDNTYMPSNILPILDEVQHKTFNFFYDGAEPTTGMIYEGTDRGNIVTIGGTGFGLSALIVGSERNWITRSQAAERTLKIVNFVTNCERFKGAWSHWYTPDGLSADFGDQIKTADIVESAFLVQGLIAAKEYFKNSSSTEAEISSKIDEIWKSIDWKFFTNNENALYWLWYSQDNKYSLPINGWNEGLMAYILGLAAPSPHNITPDVYKKGWQMNGNDYHASRSHYGYSLPLGPELGGPLFLSQYSMLGLNPHMMADNNVNYWYQNVQHTLINRHYCIYEAPKTNSYSEKAWGLTACYGAGSQPEYKARNPLNDDGVIASTAALSAFPYTPFYSTQVLLNLNNMSSLKNEYGFGDSFMPSSNAVEKRVLAIDQGPIVVMIENYRSGLIWNLVMKNENIQKGLALAGISTQPTYEDGFNKAIVNTRTKVYDMLVHPDRAKYEIDYYTKEGGSVKFSLKNKLGKDIYEITEQAKVGENVLSFFNEDIPRGKPYSIIMESQSMRDTISVILR